MSFVLICLFTLNDNVTYHSQCSFRISCLNRVMTCFAYADVKMIFFTAIYFDLWMNISSHTIATIGLPASKFVCEWTSSCTSILYFTNSLRLLHEISWQFTGVSQWCTQVCYANHFLKSIRFKVVVVQVN